ncbi:hypothetical protein [Vagococcus fluvialis]|uniref:hypothetical protein n=1 Tax=Vagococcus fluvialis TaxID=2738 RepID=UPI0028F7083C|nr:hypothetical protein [Vagococcus fluvialis]WNF91533.1 hypothetical protein QDW48_13960 [Vagococcus fluvialis]
MKSCEYIKSNEQLAYEQRSKELQEINKMRSNRSKRTITISMDQIFQLRTNKSKKVFQFQLLVHSINPMNNQFIQKFSEKQSLKVGFQIGVNSVRYYSVRKIKMSKDGRLYDISLDCSSSDERDFLINLYNSLMKG